MDVIINQEEMEDSQLRQMYGQRFNRPPSGSLNQQYRAHLNEYKQKLQQASMTDQQQISKYEVNKQNFSLLSM